MTILEVAKKMAVGRRSFIRECMWVTLTGVLLSSTVRSASPDDPKIINGVLSQTLSPGNSANLDCTVKNKGTYTLFWKQLFNGILIPITLDERIEAQNPVEGEYPNNKTKYELQKRVNVDLSLTYRLTINRLGVLDIGLYECALIKLDGGSQVAITSNGTLSLHGLTEGPRIVNKIGTVTKRVGTQATLLCLVADKGNNPVKWKRLRDNLEITSDGAVTAPNPPVDGTAKYKIVTFNTDSGVQHALTIYRLSLDDASDYQCYVQTGQAQNPYQNGKLVTGVPPELTTTSPVNITAQNNQRVSLDCTTTGNPLPPVIWSRVDGQLLPSGEQSVTSTTFNINNMNKNLRGLYRCQSTNGIYPDAEIIFRVVTPFMPTAVPFQDSVRQAVGFSITMECILEGYPDIVPLWYKISGANKTPVQKGDNYDITHTVGNGETARLNYNRFSLNIQRVKQSDYGQYQCEGTSGSNKVYGDITLTESTECLGSGCPMNSQTPSSVTQKGQSCVGDKSCKDDSGGPVYGVSSSLLIVTLIVTLLGQAA